MKRTRSTLSKDIQFQSLADLRKKTRNDLVSSGSVHIDAENVVASTPKLIAKAAHASNATSARVSILL